MCFFFTQVCCLPGAWFKALLCGCHPRQFFFLFFFFLFSFLFPPPSRFCSAQVHSLFCIKEKANPVDAGPARPRVCRSVAGLCTACSALFCAQMNETGQARAEQHKSARLQRQQGKKKKKSKKLLKRRLFLPGTTFFSFFFKLLYSFMYRQEP